MDETTPDNRPAPPNLPKSLRLFCPSCKQRIRTGFAHPNKVLAAQGVIVAECGNRTCRKRWTITPQGAPQPVGKVAARTKVYGQNADALREVARENSAALGMQPPPFAETVGEVAGTPEAKSREAIAVDGLAREIGKALDGVTEGARDAQILKVASVLAFELSIDLPAEIVREAFRCALVARGDSFTGPEGVEHWTEQGGHYFDRARERRIAQVHAIEHAFAGDTTPRAAGEFEPSIGDLERALVAAGADECEAFGRKVRRCKVCRLPVVGDASTSCEQAEALERSPALRLVQHVEPAPPPSPFEVAGIEPAIKVAARPDLIGRCCTRDYDRDGNCDKHPAIDGVRLRCTDCGALVDLVRTSTPIGTTAHGSHECAESNGAGRAPVLADLDGTIHLHESEARKLATIEHTDPPESCPPCIAQRDALAAPDLVIEGPEFKVTRGEPCKGFEVEPGVVSGCDPTRAPESGNDCPVCGDEP